MSRESVAYHEAGHAVARIELGLPITSASIIPKDDSLGRVVSDNLPRSVYEAVEFGSSLTPGQEQRIQKELVAALAGEAAEKRHTGRYNRVGSRQDYRRVDEWANRLHRPRTAHLWVRYLQALAADLIEGRWAAVEAIAVLLLDRETLRRSDLLAAYRHGISGGIGEDG